VILPFRGQENTSIPGEGGGVRNGRAEEKTSRVTRVSGQHEVSEGGEDFVKGRGTFTEYHCKHREGRQAKSVGVASWMNGGHEERRSAATQMSRRKKQRGRAGRSSISLNNKEEMLPERVCSKSLGGLGRDS